MEDKYLERLSDIEKILENIGDRYSSDGTSSPFLYN